MIEATAGESKMSMVNESINKVSSKKEDKEFEERKIVEEDLLKQLVKKDWRINGSEILIPYVDNIYWSCRVNPEIEEDRRKKKWVISWKYLEETSEYIIGEEFYGNIFINRINPAGDKEIGNRNKVLGSITKDYELPEVYKEIRDYWDAQISLLNKYKIEERLLNNFDKKSNEEDLENTEESKRYEHEKFDDYTESVQNEAKKLIKSNKLYGESLKSIAWKHKGDKETAKLELLSCVSLFIKVPVHQILNADPGEGKTDVNNRVKELIPDQYVVELPSFSEKALFYATKDPNSNLLHPEFNFLFLDDIKLTESKEDLLKLLADNERKKKIHITVIDGKYVEMELPPNWLVQINRAKEDLDNEVANRFHFNSLNTVKDNVGIKNKIKENNIRNNDIFHEKKNILLKCALQYLIDKQIKVYNPYSLFIDVKEHDNRNINRYFGFIDGNTFYNYEKRKTINGITIGSYEDVDEVLNILNPDFMVQKDKLTPTQKGIIDILKENPDEAKTGKELATELKKNPETIRQLISSKGNKKIGLGVLGYVEIEIETLDNGVSRNKYYFKKDYKVSNNENTYQTLPIFQKCILKNSLITIKTILIHYLEHLSILINKRVLNILHTFLNENHQLNPNSYNKLCDMLVLFNTEIKKQDNIIYVDSETYPTNKDLEYHNTILEKSKDDIYSLLSEVEKKMAIPINDENTLN